jgi:hypothetical protein
LEGRSPVNRGLLHREKTEVKFSRCGGACCSVFANKVDPASGNPKDLIQVSLFVPELGTKKMIPEREDRIRVGLLTESFEDLPVALIPLAGPGTPSCPIVLK